MLKQAFRPEFLNRIDDIVFYKPLERGEISQIVRLQVKHLQNRLEHQNVHMELTDKAVDFIVDAAYEPAFGARPLKRYIQSHVETLMARKLIAGELIPGQVVTVDVEDGHLVVH